MLEQQQQQQQQQQQRNLHTQNLEAVGTLCRKVRTIQEKIGLRWQIMSTAPIPLGDDPFHWEMPIAARHDGVVSSDWLTHATFYNHLLHVSCGCWASFKRTE